jgi:subtilisin family serine protease
MHPTLTPILLSGLALLSLLVAHDPLQAWSIEEQLEAIGRELSGGEPPSRPAPLQDDATLEEALRSFPVDAALLLDVVPKGMPLPTGSDKIATNLLQLVDGLHTKGSFDLAEQAEALGIPYAAGQAGVRLFAESAADVEALQERIERQGGKVITTFDNVVYAQLPLEGVKSVGSRHELHFMDAEPMYYPLAPNPAGGYGERVSEGVQLVQAQRLHERGITGKGVSVGILDFGFHRYGDLVEAGEVPQPKAQRAFNEAQRLEANTEHGTGCAEIIADMAPHASLYLAAVDGREGQIVQAAQWLAKQGVAIINFSGGWHYGPHDGSAVLDRFVAHIVDQHDLLWVNAAGNEGDAHWTQLAQDRDGNQFVDNVGGYPDVLAIKTSGRPFKVLVVWDDWGEDPTRPTASQDIDAYLLRFDANERFRLVKESREVQNGRGVPVERIVARGIPAGTVLYLGLHLKQVQRRVRTHVFIDGAQLFPVVPAYSVAIPATSEAALAVGAVDVGQDQLEAFSSQGPTDDGRQKPEVSAPDNTISLAYENGRFPGTSAAAPHVAGFAALLRQLQPGISVAELRRAVLSHVTAKGSDTPNNQYGHGRIHAGNIAVAGEDPSPDDPVPGGGAGGTADDFADELERVLQEILQRQP